MTPEETAYFRDRLALATNYFEFGCGGSTVLACQMPNIKVVTSAESNLEWSQKVLAECQKQQGLVPNIINISIGKTDLCGYAIDRSMYHNWPSYSRCIAAFSDCDTVLVDGRFRIASCLQVWLCAPDDVSLLVHDYTFRPGYHVIERFFDKVEAVGTLARFVKKVGADRAHVLDLYQKVMYQPG